MRRMTGMMMAAAFVAGCGNGGGGTGGQITTPAELIAQLSAALCHYETECGAIGASEEMLCATGFADQIANGGAWSIDEAITAGRLALDPTEAAACVAAFSAATCGGFNASPMSCTRSLIGKVSPGGMCKSSEECIGGYCDNQGISGCPSVCKTLVAAGGPCAASAECAPPNHCDFITTKTCIALGAAGAMCQSSSDCQPGFACVFGMMSATCQPQIAAGQSCATGGCAEGLFCDHSMQNPTCQPLIAANAPCPLGSASCQSGLACVGTQGSAVCIAWLDAGKACDATIPPQSAGCPQDMKCDPVSKSCQRTPLSMVGSDCGMNGCSSLGLTTPLYCDANKKCQTKLALGAACTPGGGDDPCKNGLCDGMTMTCSLGCK